MRLPALLLLCLAAPVLAGEARWLRYPAISPDGSRIAFSYRGDLWVVPADGGEARSLTRHVAYDHRPVWSPDGAWIAFASDRHGNFDVFLKSAAGGEARRLTHYSMHDVPACFTPDGTRVLFSSSRLDDPEAAIGSAWLPELYSISGEGGRPRQELTTPALEARLSADGARLVYEDFKGWESPWRKHHVSAVTHDVWVLDRKAGTHRRLSTFRGEDRDPVWSPKGTVYYLSERSGSFNVWEQGLDGEPAQVTRHGPHPVRFLSCAADGTLAYAYEGRLWVKRAGQEPRALRVTIAAGANENPERREVFRKGATEFAVAPGEDEVAFVVRGEIFVASVEHGTTKRVTKTPWQERSPTWAPDGRTLYFAREVDSSWNLFRASLEREEEEHFFQSTVLDEKPVLVSTDESFQPLASPDGKLLAYIHNRDEIRVLDLESGESRVVVPGEHNYSYRDGDIEFAWSPDSRWLAFNFLPRGRWIDDVGVARVEGGGIVNMTISGYDEYRPRWLRDGSGLAFFSNRLGRRAHASWGSEGDVFVVDLTQEAHDRANLSVEDFELEKKKKEEAEKKEEKEKKEGKGEEEEEKEPEPVEIELEGREERVRRATLHSAPLGGYDFSPDGETIVYFAEMDGKWDLWLNEIRKGETRKLKELGDDAGGEVSFTKDGEAVFVRRAKGAIMRLPLEKGEPKNVEYAAEMVVDRPAERAYIFEHCWRQMQRKFYRPDLHGVDWELLKRYHASFLPHVDNNHDFAELLSEMLGELNASHTGAYYRIPQEGVDKTASLGLLYDPAHEGPGLLVGEVLKRGPCDKAGSKIAPGVVITHIDGTALAPSVNHHALLDRKEGKRTLLALALPGGGTAEEVVKPVSRKDEWNLRYRRWRLQRRAFVEKISGGRVGYVHVRAMNDRSFRHLFSEALGRHAAKEALVVDTRWNGGGWIHNDLVQFLGGTPYLTFHPRGKERGHLGGEPLHGWAKPVAVVMNEGNYSDAHVFPYAFQKLGVGKLVGTPVAGTGTAVWWERQIDPTLSFGIPQVGIVTPDGNYLENTELKPDVEVYNDPESRARGEDNQLRKAVEVLLEE